MRAIDADACESYFWEHLDDNGMAAAMNAINDMPTIEPEIVRCKDCRYFKDITSIHGECECADMWQSLFGEVTEVEAIEVHKDHYCGYAERKTDEV